MERTRVLKPGSSLSDLKGPNYYDITDLYIGARLQVLSHHFILLDADEYVLNYMEQNAPRFKYSDPQAIRDKITSLFQSLSKAQRNALLDEMKKNDKTNSGEVDRHVLIKIVKEVFPNVLTDHELITFSRIFEGTIRRVEYIKIFQ